MRWSDTAIVLSVRKHGESSAVVRVFSREHGVYAGVVRAIASKANRGVLQPGNVVNAAWQARLSEHLGTLSCELLEAHAALLMQDAARLSALVSACAVVEASLPERHPYPKLYGLLAAFLNTLQQDESWAEAYVRLELALLAEAGFGLDLSCCAATGTTENLCYVSPKSGRAVSAEAGEPYREKLLALPGFLLKNPDPATRRGCEEILAGLRLTGYFLDHWLLEPHHRKLPAARGRLLEIIKENIVKKERHGAEA